MCEPEKSYTFDKVIIRKNNLQFNSYYSIYGGLICLQVDDIFFNIDFENKCVYSHYLGQGEDMGVFIENIKVTIKNLPHISILFCFSLGEDYTDDFYPENIEDYGMKNYMKNELKNKFLFGNNMQFFIT